MATNISRLTINASKKKVWDALTNSEKVKVWQYGSDLITDWNVGNESIGMFFCQGSVYNANCNGVNEIL